jgi:hypothetical protein
VVALDIGTSREGGSDETADDCIASIGRVATAEPAASRPDVAENRADAPAPRLTVESEMIDTSNCSGPCLYSPPPRDRTDEDRPTEPRSTVSISVEFETKAIADETKAIADRTVG